MKLKFLLLTLLCSSILFSCSDEINERESTISLIEQTSKELGVDLIIDDNLDYENSLIFESHDEFMSFLAALKDDLSPKHFANHDITELSNTAGRINCDNVDGLFKGARPVGYATLNFSISLSNGQVQRLSSYLSGITLAAGFTLGGYHQGAISSNGTIEVEVDGTLNYPLFWNGVGTFYSSPVSYRVLIGCGGATQFEIRHKSNSSLD